MFNKEEKIGFNTIFEAISEAAILVNEDLEIKTVNSSTEKMFGYQEDELSSKNLETLIPKRHKSNHDFFFKHFLKQHSKAPIGKENDLYAKHKNGSNFSIKIGLNSLNIGEEKYLIILILDALLLKNKNLEIIEQNVKERTSSLNKTVKDLEKINKQLNEENKKRIEIETSTTEALKKERELSVLKTKFLSMVSHEFKTPLTGISISTMLLGKYKLTEQQDKRKKHLSIISSKVHYLNSIINNFLSIENLEKDTIQYNTTTFKLKNVIDEVIDGANLLFKKGQEINYVSDINDIIIHQDKKIIELTISNLISNAIKYSGPYGIVQIDAEQNTKNTVIKIIDKGFGIPKKEQKNIFKRYYRAENVLLFEGTGIGLNIIKTHIENLKGTITFTSKHNVGSTFIVTLPNKID